MASNENFPPEEYVYSRNASDFDFEPFAGMQSFPMVYRHFIFSVLLTAAILINLATLIIFKLRKILSGHQPSVEVYAPALLIACLLYSIFLACLVILEQSSISPNPHGVPLFCRLFKYLVAASRGNYVAVLIFALVDRLIRILAHRSSTPSGKSCRAAAKFCTARTAKICVVVADVVCFGFSLYQLSIPYTLEWNFCYYGDIDERLEILYRYLEFGCDFILECLAYLVGFGYFSLCCIKEKRNSRDEKGDTDVIEDTRIVAEDCKAAKAFLILVGILFLTHWRFLELSLANVKGSIMFRNTFVDVALHIRSIFTALIFLLYWPNAKRRRPEAEASAVEL